MQTCCPECGYAFESRVAPGLEEACPRCLAGFALAPTGAADDEAPPLKAGASFHGMEILELLGRGGMGVVYKARQVDLDRVVALKILAPRLAADPEFAHRFSREARALAALNHPRIVHVHDFGRDGDLLYLVMEYVDGVSLRELMRERRLAPEEALRIVPQICDALECAHGQGVLHRDIKPENILVDRQGRVKVADFGLAKILGKGDAVATRTNVTMGTPQYMAPEQHENLKIVDHRADIYALGVVFYEMLTGELPVGRFDPPSHRAAIDVRLDDVVLKALEKRLDRRYQRAAEVRTDLETVQKTPAPTSRKRRWVFHLSWISLALATAAFATDLAAALMWLLTSPAVPSPIQVMVPASLCLISLLPAVVALRRSCARSPERFISAAAFVLASLSLLPLSGSLVVLRLRTQAELQEGAQSLRRAARSLERTARSVEQEADAMEGLVRQLGSDSPEERDAAQRALTLTGSAARDAVARATRSPDPEVALRAAQALQDITLAESLRKWGDKDVAFWTIVWDVGHSDPARLALVLQTAYPDAEVRQVLLNRREKAGRVLKTLIDEFQQTIDSAEDSARHERLKREVQEAGPSLVPPLLRILDYDMKQAFGNGLQKPEPLSDVYARRISAGDQVKALYAIAWLAPKGSASVASAVGRHLKNPSKTAASGAVQVLEILTGKKLTQEEFGLWASDEQLSEAERWWKEHREEYLKSRPVKR